MNKTELLAPAGSFEVGKAALYAGCDAIYLALDTFGARAYAKNFTKDELVEILNIAHALDKKVYVTVNIVLHNKELKFLKDYLIKLDEIGVDAIIVSDPAVISIAKENTNLEIHLSTQQSTLNYEALEFFKKLGVTRVVLARESTKEDIELMKKSGLEIEVI